MRANFGVEIEVLGFLELAAHLGQFVDDPVQGLCVAARCVVTRRQCFLLQQRRVAEVEYQVEARMGKQCNRGRFPFVFGLCETQVITAQAAGKRGPAATDDGEAVDRRRRRPRICGTKQRRDEPFTEPSGCG